MNVGTLPVDREFRLYMDFDILTGPLYQSPCIYILNSRATLPVTHTADAPNALALNNAHSPIGPRKKERKHFRNIDVQTFNKETYSISNFQY